MSSPVSVGILPSNRTLVDGVIHHNIFDPIRSYPAVILEQFPRGDEPLIGVLDIKLWILKLDGTTKEIIQKIIRSHVRQLSGFSWISH